MPGASENGGGLPMDAIARREQRKLRARRRNDSVWFGLGMFGLIGWAVSIPMLVGLGAGIWIDASHPGRYSWTLMLLLVGVTLGCLNAWYWVTRQRRQIERERTGPAGDAGEGPAGGPNR
ncbi:MAG: AtpZ/AtpI family protein [Phycisphaerales bacterium JB039]